MLVTCKHCGKIFNVKPSHIKRGCGKFCSRACKEASVANRIVEFDDYAKLIVTSPKYGVFTALIDLEDVPLVSKFHWVIQHGGVSNIYLTTKKYYYTDSSLIVLVTKLLTT